MLGRRSAPAAAPLTACMIAVLGRRRAPLARVLVAVVAIGSSWLVGEGVRGGGGSVLKRLVTPAAGEAGSEGGGGGFGAKQAQRSAPGGGAGGVAPRRSTGTWIGRPRTEDLVAVPDAAEVEDEEAAEARNVDKGPEESRHDCRLTTSSRDGLRGCC